MECNQGPAANTDIKLSHATRYGYGTAAIADTIILDFVSAFFLFFLTNIVGLNPALAGSVALVSVLWGAFTDPFVGSLADRSRAKSGKYRRFLLISILPVFVCTVLLFMKVRLGESGSFAYYLIVSMLYYTVYTVFNTPYMALGSALTSNEIEKTKLSAVRQAFGFAGALFSGALPAIMIENFQAGGIDSGKSYTITAAILGSISALTIFITWRSTKGHELTFSAPEEAGREGFFKTARGIFQCRSFVLLILAALAFFVGFTIISNCIMYVITGILGLKEGASSGIFILLALSGIVISFLLAKSAEKVDKRHVYLAAMLFSTLYMAAVRVIGIRSLAGFGVYIVMVNFSFSAFLVFVQNFLYDVVDVIEFRTGNRDSGAIFSYYSFMIKLGKAGALQLVGILLATGGYDPSLTIQGPSGVRAILNMMTLWPAGAYLVSIVLIFFYPVTRRRIAALQKAAALKRENKPYCTDGFETLL